MKKWEKTIVRATLEGFLTHKRPGPKIAIAVLG